MQTLKDLDEKTLADLYRRQGLSDRKIAKLYQTTDRSVKRRRDKWGIAPMTKAERAAVQGRKPRLTEALLWEMYLEHHMTAGELSEFFGVGTSTISRKRREWGIKTIDRFDSWVGKRSGRLVVVREIRGAKGIPVQCVCQCDCGAEHTVIRGNLAKTESCGCLKQDLMSDLPGHAARRHVWKDTRRSANRRGIEWGINKELAFQLFEQPCHYCGVEPFLVREPAGGCNGGFVFNGLDRIDSSRGYHPDNMVACCKHCNYAKRRMSLGEFIAHAHRIREVLPEARMFDVPLPDRRAVYPWSSYRFGARQRGLSFHLTREQFHWFLLQPCAYCGASKSNHVRGWNYMGIDRKDNGAGYSPSNCVPCCKVCNAMKRTRPVQEFLAWAARIRRVHPR